MKRGLKVLLAADMWATLAAGMLGPIYALFVAEIGGDILDASWAWFAFMITSGIVMFLISRWEDRVKHKEKLVMLGYALAALGMLSYYFVSNQLTLVITQVILGLAEAVLIPAYDSMYSHYLEKHHEASQWGDWEAMRYVVTAIAALIGGYLATMIGFKGLFLFMFIVSIGSLVTAAYLFKKKRYLEVKG